MKPMNHNQITPFQATAILVNTVISGRLLIFPREIADIANNNSWIFVILGTLVTLGLVYLYTVVGRRFSKSSLPTYCVETLGSFFGGALALSFAVSWLVMASLSARLFSAIIITSILHRVPLETGILVMLLLGTYLATQDLKTMARVQQLLYPVIMVVLVVSMAAALTRVNAWRLLPLVQPDGLMKVSTVKEAMKASVTAFLGFEIVSMFVPFYSEPKKTNRNHSLAILIIAAVYLSITVISIGALGLGELAVVQWPTTELIRLINFHGVFERLEAPFLALYVLVMFSTIGSFMFGTVSILTELFSIKTRLTWPHLLVIPAYFLALQPANVLEVQRTANMVLLVRLALILTMPLLVLPIAAIRGKGDKPDGQQAANS